MKTPKLKNKAFIIDLVIYPCKVFVVIGNIKQLKPLMLSYKYPPTENELKDIMNIFDSINNYNGLSVMTENNSIIWIDKDCDIYNVIPHEVLHTVHDIFIHLGENNLSKDNQEAYCYLNGYINEQIFKQL